MAEQTKITTTTSRPAFADRVRGLCRAVVREAATWRLVIADPRTPRPARWLIGGALAYALSPIDLIPDAIPVLGQLDDLIVVPVLLWLALRFVSPHVVDDCRRQASSKHGRISAI